MFSLCFICLGFLDFLGSISVQFIFFQLLFLQMFFPLLRTPLAHILWSLELNSSLMFCLYIKFLNFSLCFILNSSFMCLSSQILSSAMSNFPLIQPNVFLIVKHSVSFFLYSPCLNFLNTENTVVITVLVC